MDSEKSQLLIALTSSLECMPCELTSLIGEYVIRLPHLWYANGFSQELGAIVAKNAAGDFELTLGDQSPLVRPWQRFVSEVPLSAGRCEFSIEWTNSPPYPAWFGFGVTISETNTVTKEDEDTAYSDIADDNDWICSPIIGKGSKNEIRMYNSKKCILRSFDEWAKNDVVRKIWFVADPVERTVRIRWPGIHQNLGSRIDCTNQRMRKFPLLNELRPCIALSGAAHVVFSDRSIDCPAVYCEITLAF